LRIAPFVFRTAKATLAGQAEVALLIRETNGVRAGLASITPAPVPGREYELTLLSAGARQFLVAIAKRYRMFFVLGCPLGGGHHGFRQAQRKDCRLHPQPERPESSRRHRNPWCKAGRGRSFHRWIPRRYSSAHRCSQAPNRGSGPVGVGSGRLVWGVSIPCRPSNLQWRPQLRKEEPLLSLFS